MIKPCVVTFAGEENKIVIENTPAAATIVFPLDGADWLLAIDPDNEGRDKEWYRGPVAGAKATKVPWVIQDAFPDYHGVAWYWREFEAPDHPGRALVRFQAADYLAEVWLNGVRLGAHEGAEEPFVVDATDAIRPGNGNTLAVRVLSPTYEPIDGISLREVARGRRDYPHPVDNAYAAGGLVDTVELLIAPEVRIHDLHVVTDWKTGQITVTAIVRNCRDAETSVRLEVSAAPATGSATVALAGEEYRVAPGDSSLITLLQIEHFRLWQLNDPFLYRVTARVRAAGSPSADERTARCGYRDFRYENGYFRFNGRRIRLHGTLYIIMHYPVTQIVPHDEDLLRRDVLHMKAAGFNCVRITCGAAFPRQLDLFDEIGILVCEEHFGARELNESPHMEERWDRSIAGVVLRDRNHPSVVMWSLLNEVKDGRLFRHAADALKLVRSLDESRMVLLGSGRWDGDTRIGSLSNPGSRVWESDLADLHHYPAFPHTSDTVKEMRSTFVGKTQIDAASNTSPFLLSEYGVCGAQDYARFLRNFEQIGEEQAPDARLFRELLDRFMEDWEKWRLFECWARPEDYFRESQMNQAGLALDDYNAWAANPALVGSFTSTQINDAWFHGCGLTNYFREIKPGMVDAFTDMAAGVRWCLFAEPVNVYRGATVRLEAVLVNLDVIKPGAYPVRIQVVGPKMLRLLDKTISMEVPATDGGAEVPFARLALSDEVVADGPPGKYRFLTTFQKGAAARGGDIEFFVGDETRMPPMPDGVALWGHDAGLAEWLATRGVRMHEPLDAGRQSGKVILISGDPPAGGQELSRLFEHIAEGSTAILLTPETLAEGDSADGRRPLRLPSAFADAQPSLGLAQSWYFRADHWAKEHPIFEGLPCGGIMDYRFYRDILGNQVFMDFRSPVEAVSGALQTSGGNDEYRSDLAMAIYDHGAGRIVLNSLRIRENLGKVPAAEHLLRNLLRYARDPR